MSKRYKARRRKSRDAQLYWDNFYREAESMIPISYIVEEDKETGLLLGKMKYKKGEEILTHVMVEGAVLPAHLSPTRPSPIERLLR